MHPPFRGRLGVPAPAPGRRHAALRRALRRHGLRTAAAAAALTAGGGAAVLSVGPAAARPAPASVRPSAEPATSSTPSGTTTTTTTTTTTSTTAPTAPPPLTVLTGTAAQGTGDLFLTPTGDTTQYANGPEILSPSGQEIWFQALPQGESAADFRVQKLDGQPVLTYWAGVGLGGLSNGTDYILNDDYQQIATVTAGNGLPTDGHEFLITPWNTALILSYVPEIANLTSIGGPANQLVVDGVVQEINIKTGRVLFQWNSADHVPYNQSEQPLPSSPSTPWDWFHINAVHIGPNYTLLIDARNTWTTYDVSLGSGAIQWQIGGKDSSFTLQAAPGQSLDQANQIFAWQHDPEYLGNDTFTWFDNESSGTPEFSSSRTVTVKVDPQTWTATLVSSNDQPEGLVAPAEGNAQTLSNGDQLVDWGVLQYLSEFSSTGSLLFNASWPTGVSSYRGYLLPWNPGTGS